MRPFESEPPLVPAPVLRAPQPPERPILFGPLGLRAGWGVLLFLCIGILLTLALTSGLAAITGQAETLQAEQAQSRSAVAQANAAHRHPPAQIIHLIPSFVAETAETGAVLLTALGLSFLERRRFAVYGLRPGFARDLLPGAVYGFAAIGLLVGALRVLHLLAFDRRLLTSSQAVTHGFAWLFFFLLVGVYEEFLFRGYLQFTLARGLLALGRRITPQHQRRTAFWLSAIFWSLVFCLTHLANSGENPSGLASVFLAGILFSYALWRTGSLWWGIGFHTAWDWSQSFLFGVPDSGTVAIGRLFQTHAVGRPLLSGGVDGPEGSLLLIPVLLLVLIPLRLHRLVPQPPPEPEPLPLPPTSAIPGSLP